ncbi:unnamed protein product [Dicrocoelium dendriticum]|nr:unnamed protein product [Dicrocoelium dendriticum]
MDAMEKSHSLETSVISSLFNLRQLMWTEVSSVVSSIREQFESSNKEHVSEIESVTDQNRSLKKTLNQLNEIIRGKEIEIHGLRRQLRTFYARRPICFVCGSKIADITGAFCRKDMQPVVPTQCPRNQRNSFFRNLSDRFEVRKRFRPNASLSASPDTSVTTTDMSKPLSTNRVLSGASRRTLKRPCVRNSGASSIKPTTSICHAKCDLRESPSKKCVESTYTLPTNCLNTGPSSISEEGTFRVDELSPPTRQFDASLAIRNAVNHCDLGGADSTQLDSLAAIGDGNTTDDQSSITLSLAPRPSYKFVFHRIRRKSRTHQVATHLMKQRFGLGLNARRRPRMRSGAPKKPNRCPPQQNPATFETNVFANSYNQCVSDDTLADSTLPSGFLESERSIVLDGEPAGGDFLPNVADASLVSKKSLPTLGRSPTSRSEIVFKCPEIPVSQKPVPASQVLTSRPALVERQVNTAVPLHVQQRQAPPGPKKS